MEIGTEAPVVAQWFAFVVVELAIFGVAILRSLSSIVQWPTIETTHSSRSNSRSVFLCTYILVLIHSYASSFYYGYMASHLIGMLVETPYSDLISGTATIIIELICDRLTPTVTRRWGIATNDKLPLKLLIVYSLFSSVVFFIVAFIHFFVVFTK